ncbi:MAG: OsmC family protein [Nannocystaceae bacterium]
MHTKPVSPQVVVEETGNGKFQQRVVVGEHQFFADEPTEVGGDDTGPSPYDLLLGALGSCTSMTLRMYADRKKWPLTHVSVALSHGKMHARDCSECETKVGKIDVIERVITLTGSLSDEQRARLLQIADRCPVHRTLHGEIRVQTTIADG